MKAPGNWSKIPGTNQRGLLGIIGIRSGTKSQGNGKRKLWKWLSWPPKWKDVRTPCCHNLGGEGDCEVALESCHLGGQARAEMYSTFCCDIGQEILILPNINPLRPNRHPQIHFQTPNTGKHTKYRRSPLLKVSRSFVCIWGLEVYLGVYSWLSKGFIFCKGTAWS